jgi:KaiC/GvpD/RAD55 family RecA-like ATPase
LKVSTGIRGLDEMLKGGLIQNRVYLVKGGAGSGKTTLAIQFLLEGAKKGENVVYITLEEPADEVRENMSMLGLDLDLDTFHIIDASPTGDMGLFSDMFFEKLIPDVQGFKSALESELRRINPTRIAIDPITMLEIASKNEVEYRREMLHLFRLLKKFNITSLVTTQRIDETPEDFIVSGVIELLSYDIKGRPIRGIRIKKMRGSDFDEVVRPYKIKPGGIEVYHQESIF